MGLPCNNREIGEAALTLRARSDTVWWKETILMGVAMNPNAGSEERDRC